MGEQARGQERQQRQQRQARLTNSSASKREGRQAGGSEGSWVWRSSVVLVGDAAENQCCSARQQAGRS